MRCESGLFARHDLSGYGSSDPDAAIADLHYGDVAEYAIGRGTSAGWEADQDGIVRTAFTDHLPQAEVERVEPNEDIRGCRVQNGGARRHSRLAARAPLRLHLRPCRPNIGAGSIGRLRDIRRQSRGRSDAKLLSGLIEAATLAARRIADGIELLQVDANARLAFRAMNEAVARAARRRNAGPAVIRQRSRHRAGGPSSLPSSC